MEYPETVIAVCIGDPPDIDAASVRAAHPSSGSSAELCAGTHVKNTVDLVDLVVIALRGRKQAVKQFVGVVGDTARQVRLCGNRLLTTAQHREARVSEHPIELSEHIAWLSSELAQHSDHLSYADRELLQACLLRMRTQRNLGRSSVPDTQLDQLVIHLSRAIRETDGLIRMNSNPPYRPELIAEALSQIEPTQTLVVCAGKHALCYFPQLVHLLWLPKNYILMEILPQFTGTGL
ncbi:unnamed protein product [Echinostoma caproni]|uniref:tRNA_SAD domain-containing protein n=1 Tax=Echinostoma caproni TaxID=27848 RepID=A0A183AQU0_9TREM|nr:unnamed protein product [Echinostoma caproni]